MSERYYSLLDRILHGFDVGLRAVSGNVASDTGYPAAGIEEAVLDSRQRRHVAALMRVDHAGEVAAQGLYEGQAVSAGEREMQCAMVNAAEEEAAHLAWCRQRLVELDASPSALDALWYGGAFVMGVTAGLGGRNYSLGFTAESEKQVVQHLQRHLQQLPENDQRSRAILEQMMADEAQHRHRAVASGGGILPLPLRVLMRLMAKVMTTTAYRL